MSKKFLAAALLPTAAFAQQLTIPVNPTMVVTATRVAQPASSVLAPVNVVTRDEIDSSASPDRDRCGQDPARCGSGQQWWPRPA